MDCPLDGTTTQVTGRLLSDGATEEDRPTVRGWTLECGHRVMAGAFALETPFKKRARFVPVPG